MIQALIALAWVAALTPLALLFLRFARRRRGLAVAASGLLMLFGAGFNPAHPPPPPRVEAEQHEEETAEDDEPK